MQDPFFTSKINAAGIECIIPDENERLEIAEIHSEELMHNTVKVESQ
jgi:aspartate/glutamate racemase